MNIFKIPCSLHSGLYLGIARDTSMFYTYFIEHKINNEKQIIFLIDSITSNEKIYAMITKLDESVIAENSFTIYSIKLGKTKYYEK